MIRSLLEDRYQLKVRWQTRKMPVYTLLTTKSGGGKLAAASGPEPAGICPCGPGSLAPARASMKMLADQLSTQLWRVVIDKTGLTGEYSFQLQWTPAPGEFGPEALGLPPPSAVDLPSNAVSSGPSIFTALKEQLGLRLESAKGSVDVLLIDHVEKPDAD